MSDLVTGEAVVLDLRLARLASRCLAMALDLLIQVTGLFLVLLVVGISATNIDDALLAAVLIIVGVAVFIGYPVTMETLTRGRTVGKLALGLRVVREDGGPIRFRQALVRGLTWFFVDFWVLGLGGAVAMFVSLASTKGKRVGDFLAGTVVIRERIPVKEGMVAPMPPWLGGGPQRGGRAGRAGARRAPVSEPVQRAQRGRPGVARRAARHAGGPVSRGAAADRRLGALLSGRGAGRAPEPRARAAVRATGRCPTTPAAARAAGGDRPLQRTRLTGQTASDLAGYVSRQRLDGGAKR